MIMLPSLHGKQLGLGDYDARGNQPLQDLGGFVSGPDFLQMRLNDPFAVVQYDDFLGDVVADQWNFTEGTDSSTSDGAITEAVNGIFLLTPGDSAGTIAADGAQLNSALQWKASSGGLVFMTRVALAAVTSVSCFVGLTDTKSLEQPIHSAASADTITTNATDAVGFFFDSSMTTQKWFAAGVANDTDATHQNTGIAPVAATYDVLRVDINTSGEAIFSINGAQVGTKMTGALTTTVALTPCLIVRPRSAVAGKTLSIDYVYTACNRI